MSTQATICKHKFSIQISDEFVSVENITDFNPEFGGNVETWNPMETEGWSSSEKTAVDFKITVTAQRTYGATANDKIAECATGILDDVKFPCKWENPDGKTFEFTAIINTTKVGGGTAKDLDKLEFEILPIGKPTISN